MSKMKKFAFAMLMLGAVAMMGSACVVRTGAYRAPVVGTSYYNPLYYNGYVVYYDTVGRPMYYVGGARYFVPNTYANYGRLTSHYTVHRVHYARWYRARGARYRTYRRRARGRRGVRRGVRRGGVRRGGVRRGGVRRGVRVRKGVRGKRVIRKRVIRKRR